MAPPASASTVQSIPDDYWYLADSFDPNFIGVGKLRSILQDYAVPMRGSQSKSDLTRIFKTKLWDKREDVLEQVIKTASSRASRSVTPGESVDRTASRRMRHQVAQLRGLRSATPQQGGEAFQEQLGAAMKVVDSAFDQTRQVLSSLCLWFLSTMTCLSIQSES